MAQSSSAQNYYGNLPQFNEPAPIPNLPVTPTVTAFPSYPLPETAGKITLESGFPNVGAFTFDMNAAQQKAYEALKPFYDKLLEFAGGDVDLAKRVLQYSYEQGMRESRQTYEQESKQEQLLVPQEREQQLTEQNRRQIMESGFGQTDRGRLKETQDLRALAIQRALENRESRLTSERGFGMEEQDANLNKSMFNLEKQRRDESSGLATEKFNIEKAIWESKLNKEQLEEQRRIQAEQNKQMQGIGSSGSGEVPAGKTMAQWYAETGRQNLLDQLGGPSYFEE